jgi:hypothetical protein
MHTIVVTDGDTKAEEARTWLSPALGKAELVHKPGQSPQTQTPPGPGRDRTVGWGEWVRVSRVRVHWEAHFPHVKILDEEGATGPSLWVGGARPRVWEVGEPCLGPSSSHCAATSPPVPVKSSSWFSDGVRGTRLGPCLHLQMGTMGYQGWRAPDQSHGTGGGRDPAWET